MGAEAEEPPVADWAKNPMYEGTRGSTQGERKEVAPAARARGIETVAKFKWYPSQDDLLASVTGASLGDRERAASRRRLSLVSPTSRRPRHGADSRHRVRTALGSLALVVAALVSGCAGAAASARLPDSATSANYRSLYVGLDHVGVTQPPLLVATSISAVESHFPPPSPARLHRELLGVGPELYVGVTLARLSCRDNYLAKVTYGPGALLTLSVVQHQLPPGKACFELIGPVMYQVVALPLDQFSPHLGLAIVVHRPPGRPGNQEYFNRH
jgi:hypothetical protein